MVLYLKYRELVFLVYNFSELSVLQKELDERILKLHGVNENESIDKRILAFIVELGELANETRCFKYWSLKDASSEEIVLEEYVDGIHFLLSLTNTLNLKSEFSTVSDNKNLTLAFIELFKYASNLSNNFNERNLKILFENYLVLGEMLGFDKDKIIKAYLLKNKENHNRQSKGY